jgi:hypothetical protein
MPLIIPLLLRLAFVFPGIAAGTQAFVDCVYCVCGKPRHHQRSEASLSLRRIVLNAPQRISSTYGGFGEKKKQKESHIKGPI